MLEEIQIIVKRSGIEVRYDPGSKEQKWLLSVAHPHLNKMEDTFKWLLRRKKLRAVK